MKIRKFKPNDTKAIARVIKKTFLKYNHNEGSKKDIKKYVSRFDDNKLSEFKKKLETDPILLVAEKNKEIVGVVRGDKNRVWNLFVDGKYHGKGIGKKLMNKFEDRAIKSGSNHINIMSSLYAVPFYQYVGYKKTTGIRKSRTFRNLKYQPMIKKLNKGKRK